MGGFCDRPVTCAVKARQNSSSAVRVAFSRGDRHLSSLFGPTPVLHNSLIIATGRQRARMVMEIPAPCLFEANLDSAAPIVKLLNSVLVSEKQHATCLFRITQVGIKVTIESNKVLQGTATLPKQLFSPYILHTNRNSIDLRIELRSLINSINLYTDCPEDDSLIVLSNEPDVQFTLGFRLIDEDTPLILTIKSGSVETQCEVSPLGTTIDFLLFPQIESSNITCKLAIEVSLLTEVWHMFDHTCEKITVKVSSQSFTFSMEGIYGSTALEINKNHDGVDKFECRLITPAAWSYRFALLKKALRPICIAGHDSIVSLKTSTEGFLSIQYVIGITDEETGFVEYVYRPIAEDSGDSDFGSGN